MDHSKIRHLWQFQDANVFQQFLELTRHHNMYLKNRIDLVASNSWVSDFARLTMGSGLSNSYCIGFPGNRLYGGCTYIDMIEREVVELAKDLYQFPYAVVQFLSGMQANIGAYNAILKPGDTVVTAPTRHGGHYSHNAQGPLRFYQPKIEPIPFDASTYNIDLEGLEKLFKSKHPKLLVIGWSEFLFPHPLAQIRKLCDEHDVKLMYDMSHVAGLIAGGEFQPDVKDYADILTSSTGKSLHAPDHGMLLYKDRKFESGVMDAIMPLLTSNTHPHELAALGITLAEMHQFGKDYASQVIKNTKALGKALDDFGLEVLYRDLDYSESHMLLVKFPHSSTAVHNLDQGGISINACELPEDERGRATGLRLGTQVLTRRGMKEAEMELIAEAICKILLHRADPAVVRYDLIGQLSDAYSSVAYSFDKFFPLDEHWQEDSYRGLSFNTLVDLAMTIPEFSDLPIRAVRNFASRMKALDLKPGQTLFKAGQQASSIYFVMQGSVELCESNGKSRVVATVNEGESIGEEEVMFHKQWNFDARTSGTTLLLELKAKEFHDLVKSNPKIHDHFQKAREKFEEIQALDREEKGLETDVLTGQSNRRAFIELTNVEFYRARRKKQGVSIAYIDVKGFKKFNEDFGREEGDELLKSVALVMKSCLRDSDLVSRLDSDKFALLLPDTDAVSSKKVLERVQRSLEVEMQSQKWPVTFKIGTVTFAKIPKTVNDAFTQTESLMNILKQSKTEDFRHMVYS